MDLSTIEGLHPSFDEDDGLLLLELQHGKANEIGSAQLEALERLCELIEGDASISCLCTTSRRVSAKGTPIFIAGANVTERTGWENARIKEHVQRQRALMSRVRNLPIFTVAVSHGVTLGWGTEFLLTADYTLATPHASFGLPETGLGILPGARGTAELATVVGPNEALRLGCVGETIDATEALRIGLAHELVDDVDAGIARAHGMAQRLRLRSPTAVAAYKRGLLAAIGETPARRIDIERRAYELTVDTGEAAKGREAFAAIRQGDSPTWGPRTLLEL
jgi:enoyl-CoA hydratase/carnithine racemase